MKAFDWKITIDLKSLLFGLVLGISLFLLMGSSDENVEGDIRCKSVTIIDDDGNELISLSPTAFGGMIKVMNVDGYLSGLMGANVQMNGQLMLFDKNENQMLYAGTSRENTGLLKTYYANGKDACEFGKGFLYTLNDKGKVSGFIGTSSEGNGILKTFDSSGREDGFFGNAYVRFYNDLGKTTSYLGTAADSSGLIVIYDKKGEQIFSR